jgi:alkylation response protein AidB-like acyl-CoA dehydrogenase
VLLAVAKGLPGITVEAIARIDFGAVDRVIFRDVAVDAGAILARGPSVRVAVRRALALGACANAMEQMGGAAQALDVTNQYAATRIQFGRPIASFQAIKHRLADMYVTLTLASVLAQAAVRSADTRAYDEGFLLAASMAKATCSDAYVAIARAAVQVHGGIGYTWDCDVHFHLRRASALAAASGTANEHLDYVASHLPERFAKVNEHASTEGEA